MDIRLPKTIEHWLYGLTMRGDWISRIVCPVFFRWYCPHPIIDDHTAKACIAERLCGCNNLPARFNGGGNNDERQKI